jgi:hypothetical protein
VSRDDRGAYFASLITRLTTYQLRTHYLFYHSIKYHFDEQKKNIGSGEERNGMQTFVPFSSYISAMDFAPEELGKINDLLGHCVVGLEKEDLIGNSYHIGKAEDLQKRSYKDAKESGIIFTPTVIGLSLFMWAYGHGQLPNEKFFEKDLIFPNDQNIILGPTIATKLLT